MFDLTKRDYAWYQEQDDYKMVTLFISNIKGEESLITFLCSFLAAFQTRTLHFNMFCFSSVFPSESCDQLLPSCQRSCVLPRSTSETVRPHKLFDSAVPFLKTDTAPLCKCPSVCRLTFFAGAKIRNGLWK